MTERDAKTKWCPMVRLPNGLDMPAINKGQDGYKVKDNTCIASACMMWIGGKTKIVDGYEVREGYCGLAGKL